MLTLQVEAVSLLAVVVTLLMVVESCKANPHQHFSRHKHKQPASAVRTADTHAHSAGGGGESAGGGGEAPGGGGLQHQTLSVWISLINRTQGLARCSSCAYCCPRQTEDVAAKQQTTRHARRHAIR